MSRESTAWNLCTAILGLGLVVAVPGVSSAQRDKETKRASERVVPPTEREEPVEGRTSQPRSARPAGRIMKLNENTLKMLDSLPKDQLLEVAGERMTVGQVQTRLAAEQKKATADMKSMARRRASDNGAVEAEFEQAEAARLKAANAKAMDELAKIKRGGVTDPSAAKLRAIREEAAEILGRQQRGESTPADERRVSELFEQYEALQ